MMKTYDIDGNEIDIIRASELLADIDARRVARTNIVLGNGMTVTISTVHLVFDHGWNGERLIFETMAFLDRKPGEVGTPLNDDAINDEMDCCRYATLDEAREGHERMVQRLKRLTHLN